MMRHTLYILMMLVLLSGCKTIEQTSSHHQQTQSDKSINASKGISENTDRHTAIDSVVTTTTDISEDVTIYDLSMPDSNGNQYVVRITQRNTTTGSNIIKKVAILDTIRITTTDSSSIQFTGSSREAVNDSSYHHEDAKDAIKATTRITTTTIVIIIVAALILVGLAVFLFLKKFNVL